ncbi:hypothetical protein B0T16DRAFT_490314 [Cercophora newfieldiana]|uniref:Uncharacterized protein n=1 Tax=Cercophora newfieldiana TaxID=92897 RepID=A0AA40CX65_9PEZI|nr:hypothetical protein B0T16DRAFT_490314 [Cercophora newfieldiana]
MATISKLTAPDWKEQRNYILNLLNDLQIDVCKQLRKKKTNNALEGAGMIISDALMIAEETIAYRFATAMIPKDTKASYFNFHVNIELVAQWFPDCRVAQGKAPSRAASDENSVSLEYQRYCDDVRPDVPMADESNRGFGQPSRQPGGELRISVQQSVQAVTAMLLAMDQLRASLWKELCPGDQPYEGCGPWELPFPKKSDLVNCFYGPSENGEPIYRRAQRRLGEGDVFFLQSRELVSLENTHKIVLLIRPGITALRATQKRALREAWIILQEWRIGLSLTISRDINLFQFVTDFQKQAFESMTSSTSGHGSAGLEELRKLQAEKDAICQKQSLLSIKKRKRVDDETEVAEEKERLEEKQARLEREQEKLKQEMEANLKEMDKKLAALKDIKSMAKTINAEEEEIAREESSAAVREKEILSRVDHRVLERFCLNPPSPVQIYDHEVYDHEEAAL